MKKNLVGDKYMLLIIIKQSFIRNMTLDEGTVLKRC